MQTETREAAQAERDKEAREREREMDALHRKMGALEAREQELLRQVCWCVGVCVCVCVVVCGDNE